MLLPVKSEKQKVKNALGLNAKNYLPQTGGRLIFTGASLSARTHFSQRLQRDKLV